MHIYLRVAAMSRPVPIKFQKPHLRIEFDAGWS
jgi:hypothetical protein